MSDGFIAIYGCGFITGVIATLIMYLATGSKQDDRNNNYDSDVRVYIPMRYRTGRGNQSNIDGGEK